MGFCVSGGGGKPPLTRVGGNSGLEWVVAVKVFGRILDVGGRGGLGRKGGVVGYWEFMVGVGGY